MTDKEQYKKVFDKVASFGMEPLEVYRPVSYTHLDVYKRQAEARSLICSPGFWETI